MMDLDLDLRQPFRGMVRPIQLRVKADISTEQIDPEWDAFLHRWAPCNKRQTAAWLQGATSGQAQVVRAMFYKEGELEGGFQMLMQRGRLMGNIGLVRQGPIILSEEPDFLKLVLEQFEKDRAPPVAPPCRARAISRQSRIRKSGQAQRLYLLPANLAFPPRAADFCAESFFAAGMPDGLPSSRCRIPSAILAHAGEIGRIGRIRPIRLKTRNSKPGTRNFEP